VKVIERTGVVQEMQELKGAIGRTDASVTALSKRLVVAGDQLQSLATSKQDTESAVTMDMVNSRVAAVRFTHFVVFSSI
jgi:hypothetical protein